MKHCNQSLSSRLKELGENLPDVATSYNNIGMCYDSKGNNDVALKYYKQSLSIELKALGEN